MVIVGEQPFLQLLAFFRERGLSLSAERAYAQAIGRFIEWLSVRTEEFWPQENRGLIYTAFAHDLLFGSYCDGEDALGLNWTATSQKNVARLTRCLVEFSDWLTLRHGRPALNPMQEGVTYSDQLIFWRQWNKQKSRALLAHVKSRSQKVPRSEISRRSSLPGRRNTLLQETKAFPVEHIDALLWTGFINPGKQNAAELWVKFNLRDILITLLCLYGGCRESEPMHLWVDDVFVDPDDPELALVLVHEPHDGMIYYVDPLTGTKRKTNRTDYLQRFCGGKRPLTMETGRRHSGWKGNLMTHRDRNAFQVFWIDRNAGRVFLRLWRLYLEYVRPLALQTPWAFLTRDAQPLGAEAYSDSFVAAVRRIGLTPSKWSGTSTQAMRHRYGQWLNELGIGEKEGQVAMHHRNVKSQEVYRQLGVAKVAAAMGDGQALSLPSFEGLT
ncbi:phage integrase family protein (plasmid) [Polaromonas naphthalenivorans CJ2]|uniref:Phage integrase family protein n=2 Tax=Polaromonas naphthalenivorans TaxID=216465 RepID=A1VJX0_POLNA|nr:phage integrase family protein [Polaromonas naphthalenivorans CJ2]ABM39657.1 phage integrase family protein [Polaromonas naphthalenivorans CJ2]